MNTTMTIEAMRRASRLRNPSLARIFRAAGIMEQWGTGVQRVYDQVAAAGPPEPRVEEVMDRLRFTVYVTSHAPDASLGADMKHQDQALSGLARKFVGGQTSLAVGSLR